MNNSERTASEKAEHDAPVDPRSDPLFYRRGTANSRAKAMNRYYDALIAAHTESEKNS